MKVLLINGSPHENGCTYTALKEVAGALEKNGVDSEIFHIGKKTVRGCIACGFFTVLEQCSWFYTRGCHAGCGRTADHAHSWLQHGLDLEKYSNCCLK